MTSKLLLQNVFILRRPRVAVFADIIKIVTIFIKKSVKNHLKNLLISGEKILMSGELEGCVT